MCVCLSVCLSLLVLPIQTFYLPPGQSTGTSGVAAIPTHCLLVRLIRLRTVLLTDAYLVLFSFLKHILYYMYLVSCYVFLLSMFTVCVCRAVLNDTFLYFYCPHDRAKTAKTTVTKLASQTSQREAIMSPGYSFNIRSKGQRSRSQCKTYFEWPV